MLAEDSTEAEGVVPTDDSAEASQVGYHRCQTIYCNPTKYSPALFQFMQLHVVMIPLNIHVVSALIRNHEIFP